MEHSANGRPVDPSGTIGAQAVSLVEPRRLQRAKAAYTTRFVSRAIARDSEGYGVLSGSDVVPRPGDVVMARVRAHRSAQGHRAARRPPCHPASKGTTSSSRTETVTHRTSSRPKCQAISDRPNLVAAGGVAASVVSKHASMAVATTLRPVGLLSDAEGIVTLRGSAPYRFGRPQAVLEQAGATVHDRRRRDVDELRQDHDGRLHRARPDRCGSGRRRRQGHRHRSRRRSWPVQGLRSREGARLHRLRSRVHVPAAAGRASGPCSRRCTGSSPATDPDVIVLEIADGLLQARNGTSGV